MSQTTKSGLKRNLIIILGNLSAFGLLITTSQNSFAISLQLKENLDRESIDSYSLQLYAFDTEVTPGLSISELIDGAENPPAVLDIDVVVKDVNDNAPLFPQTDFFVMLRMPVPQGELLIQVTADDSCAICNFFCLTEYHSGPF